MYGVAAKRASFHLVFLDASLEEKPFTTALGLVVIFISIHNQYPSAFFHSISPYVVKVTFNPTKKEYLKGKKLKLFAGCPIPPPNNNQGVTNFTVKMKLR